MKPAYNRIVALTIAATAAASLFVSCPQPLTEDFVESIDEDVAIAVAPARTLTISGDGNGVVVNSGANTIKDGIAFSIEATAFTSHVFYRWVKSAGEGTVTFGDAGSATTTVIVTGGDATIKAEFAARPVVYYSTPTGTGIYTNTSIYVFFSKPMDEAALQADGAVTLMKGGTESISGQISMVNSSTIKFIPDQNLSPQQYHVIKIAKIVADADGAEMESEYSATFKTASTADTTPPSSVAFDIETTNPTYVDTATISLTNVLAVDEGEVVSLLITENGGAGLLVPYADEMEYTFRTSGEGSKLLRIRAVDSVENVSTVYAERTVVYDASDPNLVEFKVHGTGDGSDLYSNTTSVWMTCEVYDATAMEMRFKNGAGAWSAWTSWEEEPSLTLSGTEGAQTIYAEFRDTAFPTDHVTAASYTITLDATAPSANTMVINSAGFDSNYVSGTRTVSVTTADALSGILKVEFRVGGTLVATDTSAPFSYSWPTTSYTTGTTYAVYARAYDKAGNLLDSGSQNKIVDNAAPAVGSVLIPGTGDGSNICTSTYSVTLQQSVSDTYAMRMRFSQDNATWSTWEPYATTKGYSLTATDGYRYVYFQFMDAAGNVSSAYDYIYLDRVAPTSAAFTIDYAGSNANYVKGTRLITCTPTDAVAIWKVETYIDGSLVSSDSAPPYEYSWVTTSGYAEGSHNIYCKVFDKAGWSLSASSVARTVDNTVPTITLDSPAAGGVDGRIIPEATITDTNPYKVMFYLGGSFYSEDTSSPYQATTWDVRALTEDAGYTWQARAYDLAGNYSSLASASVTISNWTATPMTISDVGTIGTYYGFYPSIAVDSNGYFYIAYLDYSNRHLDVVRSTNSGTSWSARTSISTSTTYVGYSTRVSLAFDDDDVLYAAWNTGTYIYFARSTDLGTTWTNLTQITSVAIADQRPSIAIDNSTSSTLVHIGAIYNSGTTYRAYDYIRNSTGGIYSTQALSGSTTDVLSSITSAIISGDTVYFAWYDSTTRYLYAASRNAATGAAVMAAQTVAAYGVGLNPSISAIDHPSPFISSDLIEITCATTGGVLTSVYSTNSGGAWYSASIASGVGSARSAANVDGYTLITSYYDYYHTAYYNITSQDLCIGKSDDASTWYTYTIDSTGYVGETPSIYAYGTTSSSTFYIAYMDTTNYDLKFVRAVVNY